MLMIELWIVGWLNMSWPATGGVDDLASFAPESPSLLEIRSVAHLYYYYHRCLLMSDYLARAIGQSHTLLFAPKVHRCRSHSSSLVVY